MQASREFTEVHGNISNLKMFYRFLDDSVTSGTNLDSMKLMPESKHDQIDHARNTMRDGYEKSLKEEIKEADKVRNGSELR